MNRGKKSKETIDETLLLGWQADAVTTTFVLKDEAFFRHEESHRKYMYLNENRTWQQKLKNQNFFFREM